MPKTASHLCTECGADLPRTLEYYYKQPSPGNPDRLRSACKVCHRQREQRSYVYDPAQSRKEYRKRKKARQAYQRRYYAKHRESLQAYGKAWRERRKREEGANV